MKLRAIIVDDESSAVRMLLALLKKYCPHVEVIHSFQDPFEAYEMIKFTNFELLFLDINMPGLSGFELLEKLSSQPFEVVFTTAHDQYALDAFKSNALDYIMKPIDEEDLIRVVKKVEDKNAFHNQQINEIVNRINKNNSTAEYKVAIPFFEGLEFISIKHIIYCMAENNYTNIFLMDGSKRMVSKTLKEIENLIPKNGFFRVHNSYLINLNHVKKYMRTDGGYLIMVNDHNVKISRSKKGILLDKL